MSLKGDYKETGAQRLILICSCDSDLVVLCFREWYTNGDYLVLMVSVVIILPLSLLRNLGKRPHWLCVLKI